MWHAMILHLFIRDFHTHTPSALFHPVICSSHTSLGEIDYRLHKSNSTYLSDLDIARSHLASHLLARAGHLLARNAKTRILMDPSNPSQPARGPFNIGIGSIYVSFKKEIKPYQQYEMWSRVLSWDKKWLYILTHFIQKGAAKPRSWDAEYCGPLRTSPGEGKDWEKKIYTTAVTTYVFKLGRLTIHPAIMLGESGLLPTRPGGWVVDPDTDCVLDGSEMPEDGELMEWTWQRTESERRKGMQIARHVAALSDLHTRFDSGEDGALGYFPLG
ncbi:capsule polysaccharide biosynthesis protein [Xylariaceae sp. FL1272]|nr:capsule polysaccharide biosynthesis protein [Xylariaceae sp. FL1272]